MEEEVQIFSDIRVREGHMFGLLDPLPLSGRRLFVGIRFAGFSTLTQKFQVTLEGTVEEMLGPMDYTDWLHLPIQGFLMSRNRYSLSSLKKALSAICECWHKGRLDYVDHWAPLTPLLTSTDVRLSGKYRWSPLPTVRKHIRWYPDSQAVWENLPQLP